MNPRIKAVRCLRCGAVLPISDYLYGCPHCLENGLNSSVTLKYEGKAEIETARKGMERYVQFLPYSEFPSLGEGGTPVVKFDRIAEELGLSNVYTKNEFQNPTGSHKDRMNPFFIARAKELGKRAVCCASTGNEAVSLSLYAAAAGIRCICVSTKSITPIWKAAVEVSGSELVLVDSQEERKEYLQKRIDKDDWYCTTNQLKVPVGSPCFGVQGYKTIAYELYERFESELPDFILVPTARGDLLYGIYEGFSDLMRLELIRQIPKLVAAEPIPRLEKVLAGADYRSTFVGDTELTPSIGGGTATYQSKYALDNSRGFAVSADRDQVIPAIKEFAASGIYLESSSAITLACLKKAVEEGKIRKGSSVLMVVTSHGFKNAPSLFGQRGANLKYRMI